MYNYLSSIKSILFSSIQGSYHSGYPTMGNYDPKTLGEVNLHVKFSEVSVKASWAIGHELGHNVQWLTGFPHTKYGETTNNFWAMYCYEKV
jgi:hypothetical protein